MNGFGDEIEVLWADGNYENEVGYIFFFKQKTAYEIQINNRFPDPHPTGSIYGFKDAEGDFLKENDWNTLDIESRTESIRVKLNGHVVAEHAGDPARSKTGPIGLQLHDRFTTAMVRTVRIREAK